MAAARFPAVDLRSVTVETVFNALSRISDRYETGLWGNVNNVWILQPAPDNWKTKVFYVGHLLGQLRIDDLTTAIRSTWQLADEELLALFPGQPVALVVLTPGRKQLLLPDLDFPNP